MRYFTSPEANTLFSAAILLEKIVLKAQKGFDKKEMSAQNFINLREELINIARNTNELIDEVARNNKIKKSFYLNSQGEQNA